MKHWGVDNTLGIASVGVSMVLAGVVAWLLNRPATVDCRTEVPADRAVHRIVARKVVVQPWLGEHHVYGVFMVPNRYKDDEKYVVALTVRGIEHFAQGETSGSRRVDGVSAEPGHYLLRRYVRTRLALWFLVNGLFGDLRRPCNWALVFSERAS